MMFHLFVVIGGNPSFFTNTYYFFRSELKSWYTRIIKKVNWGNKVPLYMYNNFVRGYKRYGYTDVQLPLSLT